MIFSKSNDFNDLSTKTTFRTYQHSFFKRSIARNALKRKIEKSRGDKKVNHLVIGKGEIGQALYEVLEEKFPTGWVELNDRNVPFEQVDVIHICYPYTDSFIETSKKYIEEFKPKLIIIHATVKLGTSYQLDAVYSPVRGTHPNLKKSIKTFVKFFGGERAEEAAKIFEELGIKTHVYKYSDDVEAGKILDTAQYGWMIILNKLIFDWCKTNNINFELAYTLFNETYNEGYQKLGKLEVMRPYLQHMYGPIGGHCVIPNLKFLDSVISELINKVNEELNES